MSKRKTPNTQDSGENDMEYAVYIYHRQHDKTMNTKNWERKTTTGNLKRAMLKAKRLYNSKKYEKVEVQQNSLNQKTNQKQNKTLKIYEGYLKNKTCKTTLFFLSFLGTLTTIGLAYVFMGKLFNP